MEHVAIRVSARHKSRARLRHIVTCLLLCDSAERQQVQLLLLKFGHSVVELDRVNVDSQVLYTHLALQRLALVLWQGAIEEVLLRFLLAALRRVLRLRIFVTFLWAYT